MGKRHHPLSGHTELYSAEPGRSSTYMKVTRHMPHRNKTYFMFYFANPRPTNGRKKDPREPDVYRYYFRIRWKDEPILEEHKQTISGFDANNKPIILNSEWKECSKTTDFNLFPNYRVMVDKIKSLIVEYDLLRSSTDTTSP